MGATLILILVLICALTALALGVMIDFGVIKKAKYAKAAGIAISGLNSLREALKDGEITKQEFLDFVEAITNTPRRE